MPNDFESPFSFICSCSNFMDLFNRNILPKICHVYKNKHNLFYKSEIEYLRLGTIRLYVIDILRKFCQNMLSHVGDKPLQNKGILHC